uniref:Uncharacterized protein n=1 Tax=Callorhinchus milii TaxID=7868 RepID=A0A4W3ILI4_CALMI
MVSKKKEKKIGTEDESSEIDGDTTRHSDDDVSTSFNITDEMKRMLKQLQEKFDIEDDCDSLIWEENKETLLLWKDFSEYTAAVEPPAEDETIETVIEETELLFKTLEKEYQEDGYSESPAILAYNHPDKKKIGPSLHGCLWDVTVHKLVAAVT